MNSTPDTAEAVLSATYADFQVHLRFITDRCVAARVDAREQPEWPPHPGRLFMALAAAFFETDGTETEKREERAALEWLADLPAPHIAAVEVQRRSAITCFVPVNDALSPNLAMLQSAPGMSRSRQPRAFPTVIPQRSSEEDGADVTYQWQNVERLSVHLPALDRLCRNVIRIGHSSSFVAAWVETGATMSDRSRWEPTESAPAFTCRVASNGELDRLQYACQAERIEQFAVVKDEIETTSGKAQTAAKKRFAETFGEAYKASTRPPEPIPPTIGVWQGYRCGDAGITRTTMIYENTYFEQSLLILAKLDGPTVDVERTLGLTQALRLALIAAHGKAPIPAWLSGHEADGAPTVRPHAAFLALPFAGFNHADGHVMGLAIALPKGVAREERARWLGPLLVDPSTGESAQRAIRLWGRGLPDWTIQLEERISPPHMLQNATWTGPSTTWASVTPVVLDRFPKADRVRERATWEREVCDIVILACSRAGLPEPSEVRIGSTAFHSGIPRAWTKCRQVSPGSADERVAPLGDGFPSMPGKSSRPPKPQVHVRLEFAQRVAGPVLLGAGRFQGYGLCLPVRQ